MKWIERISAVASGYFALWVILASAIGLARPSTFLFALPHIKLVLGIIMFGMGMTLSLDDFKRVLARPKAILTGVCAQYLIMPLLAFGIKRILSGLQLDEITEVEVSYGLGDDRYLVLLAVNALVGFPYHPDRGPTRCR